jgi:hypothetical protein
MNDPRFLREQPRRMRLLELRSFAIPVDSPLVHP